MWFRNYIYVIPNLLHVIFFTNIECFNSFRITQYSPLQTQNCPLAAHIPTAFLADPAGTELPYDANRSIGRNYCYCVGTTGDGPYAPAGIVVVDTSCK